MIAPPHFSRFGFHGFLALVSRDLLHVFTFVDLWFVLRWIVSFLHVGFIRVCGRVRHDATSAQYESEGTRRD